MDRTKPTLQDIESLAKAARLELSAERKTAMLETMPGIFEMLDTMNDIDTGETAPAITYRAKWDNQ